MSSHDGSGGGLQRCTDSMVEGRKMGRKIGKQAWRKALTYFHGTAGTPLDDSRRGYDDKEDDRDDQDDND